MRPSAPDDNFNSPAPNESDKRVSSDFGSATVILSVTSGPAFTRFGRSTLNPQAKLASGASASTSIAEIIFTFMGYLLLCFIRRRYKLVAKRTLSHFGRG